MSRGNRKRLHFHDQRAYLSTDDAETALRQYIPAYDKSLPEGVLSGRYRTAHERARRLARMHERNGTGGNPSTDVDQLVEVVLAACTRSARDGEAPADDL